MIIEKCRNCDSTVFSRYSFCPNCGNRVVKEQKVNKNNINTAQSSGNWKVATFILLGLVLVGVISGLVFMFKDSLLNSNVQGAVVAETTEEVVEETIEEEVVVEETIKEIYIDKNLGFVTIGFLKTDEILKISTPEKAYELRIIEVSGSETIIDFENTAYPIGSEYNEQLRLDHNFLMYTEATSSSGASFKVKKVK